MCDLIAASEVGLLLSKLKSLPALAAAVEFVEVLPRAQVIAATPTSR
jgi:hypothetical protein